MLYNRSTEANVNRDPAYAFPRPGVTLDHLHTFLAVAEQGHLTRAARALGLSQAAVSTQIRSLEDALGVGLFVRAGRGISITEAGKEIRTVAARALEAALVVESVASQLRGIERGRLRIAASHTIGTHRLPEWLRGFTAQHPGINIELRLEDMASALGALDAGSVDCAIVGTKPDSRGREVLRLDGDRLLLVVSAEHPLARSHQPLRELHRHRYLARGQGSATETLARRLLGTRYAAGPVANVQRGAVQQALLSGIGYAVMPAMVVESHVTAGRLHVIDLPGRSVEQPITAVRREEDSSPALDAWWTYLTQERRTKQARGTPRKAGSATRRC